MMKWIFSSKNYGWLRMLYFLLSFAAAAVLYFRLPTVQFHTDTASLLIQNTDVTEESLRIIEPLLKNFQSSLTFLVEGESHIPAAEELRKQLRASPYFEKEEVINHTELLSFLYKHQTVLPSSAWKEVLKASDPVNALRNKITFTLSSPTTASEKLSLTDDPLLLVYFYLQDLESLLFQGQETGVSEENLTLFSATLTDEAGTRIDPGLPVEYVSAVVATTEDAYDVSISWSGYLRFAADSSQRIKKEITWFSSLGTVVIILVTFTIFRSPRQLLLSTYSVFFGLFSGVAATVLTFGSIHAVTIGFGAGLLGVSVDYALHFFCEQLHTAPSHSGKKILWRIFPAIGMGMLTSGIVFLLLGFSSFPGLRELSVFACAGLFGSFVTVVIVFPQYSGAGFGRPEAYSLTKAKKLFELLPWVINRRVVPAYILVALVTAPGIFQVTSNDDIRNLQSPGAALVEEEQRLRKFIDFSPTGYILVSGRTEAELQIRLELAHSLIKRFKAEGTIEDYSGPIKLLPSISEQRAHSKELIDFLKKREKEIWSALVNIGYEEAVVREWFRKNSAPAHITFTELLSGELEPLFRPYLFKSAEKVTAILPVSGKPDKLQDKIPPNMAGYTEYFNQAENISRLFADYRIRSIYTGIIAYGIIFLIFVIRYGVRNATAVMMPSIATAAVILAVIGYSGMQLNFFHILGLIIVLGLSVDYNIFFLEERKYYPPVCLTVLLSTVSTVFAFGFLTFSSTLLLSSFGLTIGVGVLAATALAPLAIGGNSDSV